MDALAQQWIGENNFVNPPFWLLPRVLQLIHDQKVCATVIAPKWTGQLWYRLLQKMLVAEPLQLQQIPGMFLMKGNSIPEPTKNQKWVVCAWRLDGKRG